MRIIAGTHRGRQILAPADDRTTRPMPDRIKQSLFDRLWALGLVPSGPRPEMNGDESPPSAAGTERPPPQVLDLFCGTGSLGLEALSRGAEVCTFIDRDRDAIDRLRRNLEALRLTEQARVLQADALSPTWLRPGSEPPIRLAFIDPPYALLSNPGGRNQLMIQMRRLQRLMDQTGAAVLRTPKQESPPAIEGWSDPDTHTYGSMALHLYFCAR